MLNGVSPRLLYKTQKPYNKKRKEKPLFIISYLHQFFNEQKCQLYIHELRWKERQLECTTIHAPYNEKNC